jgi:hypothetical protein
VEAINTNFRSVLDNLRAANGTEGLRSYYSGLLKKDRSKALDMINNQQLSFGTLFAIRHELSQYAVTRELDVKYQKALKIAEDLTGNKVRRLNSNFRSDDDHTASVLRWMIETGGLEDDLGKQYDRLMEFSAALLIKRFKDISVLAQIAEMFFSRHRKGKYIHDLVWAFFEGRSVDSILIIAKWLNSYNIKDRELAYKLLSFIPALSPLNIPDPYGYTRALVWLQENKPFVYYTGESLHQSSSPIHFKVSRIAKYLCRPISVDTAEPLFPFNEFEKRLADSFKNLPDSQQQLLADFSYMLYRRNIYQWHTFLRLDVNEQLALAFRLKGGLT